MRESSRMSSIFQAPSIALLTLCTCAIEICLSDDISLHRLIVCFLLVIIYMELQSRRGN